MIWHWYCRLCAINYPAVLVFFWLAASVMIAVGMIAFLLGFRTIALISTCAALVLISLPGDIGSPFEGNSR